MEAKVILRKKKKKLRNLSGNYFDCLAVFEIQEMYNAQTPSDLTIIYAPNKSVEGYWLVWRSEGMPSDPASYRDVIGITPCFEKVKQKVCQLAKQTAQNIARLNRVAFVDKSSRAKEGELAAIMSSLNTDPVSMIECIR